MTRRRTSIRVVIPHSPGDDAHRAAARAWVTDRYRTVHRLPVIEAPAPPGDWCKAAAVNPAVDELPDTVKVAVIADADSYVTPEALDQAIADAKTHGWAMPHRWVHRIAAADTARILAGDTIRHPALQHPPASAIAGGGIVVVTADAWRTVAGFDPGFVGWGYEDSALGLALDTLVHRWRWPVSKSGPRGKIPALWHLWHPPQPDRTAPRDQSVRLFAAYQAAHGDPDAMEALAAPRRTTPGYA